MALLGWVFFWLTVMQKMCKILLLTTKRIIVFLLFITAVACSSGSNSTNEEEKEGAVIFKQFANFPNQQFKNLELGQTNSSIESTIAIWQFEEMANAEVVYLYFPADSTKLILPKEQNLNEFKLFLYSKAYIEHEQEFRAFLAASATKITKHTHFPVFEFEINDLQFKLTYFLQSTYIRLHFILKTSA